MNTDVEYADGFSVIPSFSVQDSSAEEGNSVNFSFSLDEAASEDFEVHWAVEFINSDADDLFTFTGISEVKSGDMSFTVSIPTNEDNSFEANEEFNLKITKINNKETDEIVAKGIISNNDPAPTVQFQNPSQTKAEGTGVATALVLLDVAAGVDVFVPYTLGGTTDSGDHDLVADMLFIPAGDLATGFAITITDDTDPEVDENLIITLSTPINGQLGAQNIHTLTIQDNDAGVNILSPLATGFIHIANETSFAVSGSCSSNGQEVTISADDTNGGTAAVTPGTQPTCIASGFTVNLDLSSLDDDNITINADHMTLNDNVTLVKDTSAPAVSITSPLLTDYIRSANETSVTVTGVCSESGVEVTISADDTNGGTAAVTPGTQPTCTGGNTFTVNLDLSSLDDDNITITANHEDLAGNNATQDDVTLTKDTAAPTIAIEQSVSETIGSCVFTAQGDPAVVTPVEYKITTNEAIDASTLVVGDIDNSGTGGGTTLTWTITNCGDDTNFSLKATAITPMGTIIPDIAIGKIEDVAGNTNTAASSSSDNSVNYIPNPFLWLGTTNSNWSEDSNWSGGTAPGASDIATFDSTCGGSCNATIDASINVSGIDMQSGYTGTITQGAGNTITVGLGGWTQQAGNFVGSSSGDAINLNIHKLGSSDTKGFQLLGGSFQSTNEYLRFSVTQVLQPLVIIVRTGSLRFNRLRPSLTTQVR